MHELRRFGRPLSFSCLLLAACAGPPIAPVDAALDDDASFAPVDASDGTCGEITVRGFGQLPDSCLPRCSAETRIASESCADFDCILAAAQLDDTPVARVVTPGGELQVACGGTAAGVTPVVNSCLWWQQFSCAFDVCPDEYVAFASCTSGPCTTERSELQACVERAPTYRNCADLRIARCFS